MPTFAKIIFWSCAEKHCARGRCRNEFSSLMQFPPMNAVKSAGAIWPGGSQLTRPVARCQHWALDKGFTWDLLTRPKEHHAEITRQTQIYRSPHGIFEYRRTRGERRYACSARRGTYAGRSCAGTGTCSKCRERSV